ncbi:aspartate kinase [uncultured Dokdonia sp.]|uniref:aspartate kinase n=1 Tax=uncultured Dokdonia sp. TaxID=575653 RepID=UPI00261A3DFA|nr:aspartate kinase [uncultured Dokdonia sp.]
MRVLKFGGTSVGSVENMIQVKEIVNDQQKKIVVLSAMSGTTNALVAISNDIKEGNKSSAVTRIDTLEVSYTTTIQSLFSDAVILQDVQAYVKDIFFTLKSTIDQVYHPSTYNTIVSYGELLSTYIFSAYLRQEGINVQLLPALDFMRIDRNHEPDTFYIRQNIHRRMDELPAADIYITQGFICLDVDGKVSNLQRGGSDYTATIIGAAIHAEEVQIWTDIDGFHNNDPRFVEKTTPISNLSFDEAAELAYFGAKILHPQTVTPVRELDIPVRLKNTMKPNAHGTLITNNVHGEGIKAIAAKDGITAIKIKSGRMLLAHGFLKKIFEIFERYETSIDMITTSEIAVSLTIDDATHLDPIVEELERFSFVEVDQQQAIVCLVGHSIIYHHQTHKLFQILQDVAIRMISYGGSHNNISLLIHSDHKIETLQRLHTYLFDAVTV